jgi:hypothetical protein
MKYFDKRNILIFLVALLMVSLIFPIIFPLSSFGHKEALEWLKSSKDVRASFGADVEFYVLSHSGKLSISEVNCSHFTFVILDRNKPGMLQVYLAKMPDEPVWKVYDYIPSIAGYTKKSCASAVEKPALTDKKAL